MSNKKFNVGDKVRYIGKDHLDCPEYYPAIGTVGKITGTLNDDPDCYVQWPKNSTGGNDEHWCSKDDIELVEDIDMTNEEIWKMLKSKMEKNALKSVANIVHTSTDGDCSKFNLTHVYAEDDVHNAIALAYKVGYLRSQKGRPFKISNKKRNVGHWEWIKPGEIVPDGTKVRYMKRAKDDNGNNLYYPKIGQECMKLNPLDLPDSDFWTQFKGARYKYICLNNSRDCFQKWVEDNE